MPDFSRIFLLGHAQYRFLFLELARRLATEHGSEIHLYCAMKQASKFWHGHNETGVFADITANETLYRAAAQPVEDAESLFARARELEEWLGTTINTLAVSDRHLGRGYALAGFKHPRSRQSEATSYAQMVAGFVALIEFWRNEFEAKSPTLVINCGKVAALICRKMGIPYRTLAGSRYKNFHQWAHNEFFENPRVESGYRKLAKAGVATIEAPYHSHMTLRRKFVRNGSLVRVALRTGTVLLRHLYRRISNNEKAIGYFALEEVSYVWRRRQDMKQLKRLSQPLAALEGQRFVFYPLHTEPETALQALSPEYFYQLSCIAALSRDLPAGVVLAVKETYEATGRRPADFYRQIAEFKNVVILDMMELGLDVVRRADAVATITGTAGFEAAVMGKPVITFGLHNQYNFLPHVSVVVNENELKDMLHSALADGAQGPDAKVSGAKFLQAVCDESFDFRDYDYINLDRFEPNVIDDAMASLERSLEPAWKPSEQSLRAL